MTKPYARTRWNADGLVEITLDVDTAQKVYAVLHNVEPQAPVVAALANTLAKPDGEGKRNA
jgi:hypothetical protein